MYHTVSGSELYIPNHNPRARVITAKTARVPGRVPTGYLPVALLP